MKGVSNILPIIERAIKERRGVLIIPQEVVTDLPPVVIREGVLEEPPTPEQVNALFPRVVEPSDLLAYNDRL